MRAQRGVRIGEDRHEEGGKREGQGEKSVKRGVGTVEARTLLHCYAHQLQSGQ